MSANKPIWAIIDAMRHSVSEDVVTAKQLQADGENPEFIYDLLAQAQKTLHLANNLAAIANS